MSEATTSEVEGEATVGIPIRNLWLLMLYASDLFRTDGTKRVDREELPDRLPDVIAEVLAHAVEERLRRNLHRAYEERRAILDRVRGSIDLLRTESAQLLERGKVACRFEELTFDTPRNRYVRGALESIARVVEGHALRRRCRALAHALGKWGVGARVPSSREIGANRFGRHDVNDRFMVAAARLAFDLALPTEAAGQHLLSVPNRGDQWLRKLFEHAVFGFYRVVLPANEWQVSHGHVLDWPVEAKTPGLDDILPRMETDIELLYRATGRKIVIDTKFTAMLKPGQYRDRALSSGYLYQIYAYLRTQEEGDSPWPTEGVLLHPTVGDPIDEAAEIQGHVLRFMTVDLHGTAEAFRTQLMRILEPAGAYGPDFTELRPNATTVEAIEAARRGEVVKLGTPAQAIAELNRDD